MFAEWVKTIFLQKEKFFNYDLTCRSLPQENDVETVCCLYHQKKDFISVPYELKDAEYLNT